MGHQFRRRAEQHSLVVSRRVALSAIRDNSRSRENKGMLETHPTVSSGSENTALWHLPFCGARIPSAAQLTESCVSASSIGKAAVSTTGSPAGTCNTERWNSIEGDPRINYSRITDKWAIAETRACLHMPHGSQLRRSRALDLILSSRSATSRLPRRGTAVARSRDGTLNRVPTRVNTCTSAVLSRKVHGSPVVIILRFGGDT